MITKINRDMDSDISALVLAAGEGTRMKPLSEVRPKALMPTLGLPQMSWQVARLHSAGVEDVWVNAHFHASQIEEEAGRISRVTGKKVGVSLEKELPLGTAGALRRLSEDLGRSVVVINSDVACDLPISKLIEAHSSSKAAATLLAIPSEDQADLVLEEGWVKDLVDRSDKWRAGHVYAGIGIFEKDVLRFVPDGASGLFETVFLGAMREELPVAALEWNGYWRDVGNPEAHLRINLDALSGEYDRLDIPRSLMEPPDRDDALAFVGEGAEMGDVELRHSVVGHAASIEPGSRLERCVVWDSVQVRAGDYRNTIFTGSLVLEVD
jgi:mannose-1-phosphate guanylyltransferase/phosphomannomutase